MAFSTRRDIAVHEAAHAVVGKLVGGTVLAVDIGNGPEKKRKTYTDWAFNVGSLPDVDWLDPDEADAARTAVRNIVTCFVAGEVAEKDVRPMTTLSERITDADFAAEGDQPRNSSDLWVAVWLLQMAGIGSLDEVILAEQRAKAFIDHNIVRLNDLADLLLEEGYVKDAPLYGILADLKHPGAPGPS